ncbi:hypothetical protein A499_01635 [Niallia nealsonii AAU1]|nr:hypothetical protein A499_01635 [Niallia nealsonii AAU1]
MPFFVFWGRWNGRDGRAILFEEESWGRYVCYFEGEWLNEKVTEKRFLSPCSAEKEFKVTEKRSLSPRKEEKAA